jgi:hypothetical protein
MSRHDANTRRSLTLPRIAIAALLGGGVVLALAADWPVFKPGQWTFERTLTGMGLLPKPITRNECTDPTADYEKQREMLAKSGCVFTPITQSGNTYRYSATCKMGGTTSTSNSVLVVESAEAYTITIDSDIGGQKSHEVLKARRTGDCAK